MITNKYPEENIKWEVVGFEQLNKLHLDPAKKVDLHTNNLMIDKFRPGSWLQYESKYDAALTYIVYNDNYTIRGYRTKKFVRTVDKELSHKGIGALAAVKAKFKELQNGSFKTCFGTVKENILRCVPKQLYWSKNACYVGPVNSVDFSSHYPANLCFSLPDSHTAKTVKGTVKPTKEYPFAFYIESGHIAIYNELDTHTWLLNDLKAYLFRTQTHRKQFDDRFNPYIEEYNDTTILMKASKYTLKEVYEYFYNIKLNCNKDTPEYELAKLVLNASIGQMHRRKYDRDKYAHLAAVCIARANQKILDIIKKIPFENIIQIQVDGILYTGSQKVGIDEVYLGAPVQEVYQRPCRWDRIGVYMIDLGGKFKVRCQGYNSMTDGRNPEESTSFDDMDKWINVEE